MKIRKIDLRNIDGFKTGNAEDIEKGTGCTAIICEDGAVAGVDVRGGAPATRETDLLRAENTVERIHCVVLSGGSAFGLEASSGVMRELSSKGIGFEISDKRVPIVCAASLYDLDVGDPDAFPDIEMGKEAVRNAYEGRFRHGNFGAGTGASVGKSAGMSRAMKSGLGTFACADDHVQVGAIVAVNAVGDVYNGAGNIIAGLRDEEGTSIFGSINHLKDIVHSYEDKTPSAEEAGTGFLSDEQPKNKDEIANAIKHAFDNVASETVSIDEEEPEIEPETAEESEESKESDTENLIQEETEADATIQIEPEIPAENEIESEPDPDMGYDIPFNTTIGCLITNAMMTKSQANKLASILHDAYARAIKPVHSTMDGDTIFVLTTATCEVNFDAFAALATDVVQYAIIDAVTSSESAYGLPASCDIKK